MFINDYLYAIHYDWYNSDAGVYKIDSGLDDIVFTKQILENENYISDVKYANYYPDSDELRIFFTSDYFSLANYNLESDEIQYINFKPKKYEYGWDECVCYNLNYFVEKDNFK